MQIQDYFQNIRDQVITLSESTMAIEAMVQFKRAFRQIEQETHPTAEQWQTIDSRLQKYYREEFIPRLEKNLDASVSIDKYYPTDKRVKIIQNLYIAANPSPVGSKNKLDTAGDGSTYSSLHKKFHPIFRDFLEKFGYYDLFLVDSETGRIVYTVFKEVDFATSLLNGPFSNTNIADLFNSAIHTDKADYMKLVDFAPYPPSYNAVASFIVSPIYDESGVQGLLMFQIPIDKINDIMTSDRKWSAVGLGDSGESYLIGQDFTLKNQSRFFIDDRENFLKKLEKKGISPDKIKTIRLLDSVIGILTVETPVAKAAINGSSNQEVSFDYLGVPVLSAYKPLEINGLNWAIISEINKQEALAPAYRFRNLLFFIIGLLAVIIVLTAVYFSRSISKPIRVVANGAMALGMGDLSCQIQVDSQDEVGELSAVLNDSVQQLKGIVIKVKDAAFGITSTAEEVASGSMDLASRTNQQAASVTETSAALEEFSAAVKENSLNAEETNTKLASFFKDIHAKMELIDNVTKTMGEINNSSKRIDNIVKLINDISFQTNLLALNAAVEAARAGEAGRGFAVVAAEVRNLAQKTAESSKSIQDIISQNVESTNKGMELVSQTSKFFTSIIEVLKVVSDKARMIADSSREQTTRIDQISTNLIQVEEAVNQNAALSEEFSATVGSLKTNATELEVLVKKFKVENKKRRQKKGDR
jgi:methyl-accepting chemotaxis protein